MTIAGFELKYLWSAVYADGSLLAQTPADVSTRNPERSEFFDALEEVKTHGPIVRFILKIADPTTRLPFQPGQISVDLVLGHFEIDGHATWIGRELPPDPEVVPLKLVFFRQHTHRRQFGSFRVGPTHEATYGDHLVRYCLGWEADVPVPDQEPRHLEAILGVY